jgi:capsular polysaccharide transport system permease protein
MIQRLRNSVLAQATARISDWSQGWLAPVLLRRRTFRVAFIASLLATVYWGLLASDRYVSEAHVVIQRTDLSSGQSMDFGSLLAGVGANNRSDQMLLRDHLLSVDMLEKLDARLDLRAHYSDSERDLLSRMWGKDRPLELFHRHYLSRISIEFDENAGVLVIKAQGYTPKAAHAITSALVEEGERYMNALVHRLAQEQVSFLEQQVEKRAADAQQARQALLAFQNEKGLVSPQGPVESLAATINRLEAQLTEIKTTRSTRLGYLSTMAPAVVELDLQIKAIERQISREQARLASPGGQPLNVVLEEYQRLQLAAEFDQDIYKNALTALEIGRVEATRTLKKVSILQAPTPPQYPLEPRRLYNIVVFILAALILAGIIHLLAAIIRDHKD